MIDFDMARRYLAAAERRYGAGDVAGFIAARYMLAVALGVERGSISTNIDQLRVPHDELSR
jgi:hypothetical protein